MAHAPLELPPIPPTQCNQAQFAKILLDQEAADFNALELGQTEVGSLYLVDEALLTGRERRLRMMSDYLIDYAVECEGCADGEVPAECPMKNGFDFIVGTLITISEDK